MKITEDMIPTIEAALGFKLYDWQRSYLLGEEHVMPNGRKTGRTTAYIVKILLTNPEPIDIKLEAMKYKDHKEVRYTQFFRNEVYRIDEKLATVGLDTVLVKHNGAQRAHATTLEIGVDLDTDSMTRKLRAISKHTAALAEELDAIDEER